MTTKDELLKSIHEWNGKHNDVLITFYHQHHESNIINILLEHIFINDKTKDACTWLIKQYLENGFEASESVSNTIASLLEKELTWGATLHIVQTIPFLQISDDQAVHFYDLIEKLTTNKQNFIRAWSYNALYDLSQRYHIHQDRTIELLKTSYPNESASVKARIRNLIMI